MVISVFICNVFSNQSAVDKRDIVNAQNIKKNQKNWKPQFTLPVKHLSAINFLAKLHFQRLLLTYIHVLFSLFLMAYIKRGCVRHRRVSALLRCYNEDKHPESNNFTQCVRTYNRKKEFSIIFFLCFCFYFLVYFVGVKIHRLVPNFTITFEYVLKNVKKGWYI